MSSLEQELNELRRAINHTGPIKDHSSTKGPHHPYYIRDIPDSRDGYCAGIDWKVDTLPQATVSSISHYTTNCH